MNVIVVKDYQEMSQEGGQFLYNQIKENPNITLGLATGGTPIGVYQELIKRHKKNPLQLSDITTFNLDEYIGLSPVSPNSYHYYMKQHLFGPLRISSEQAYLPNGTATNPEEECNRYERLIKEKGGIDVQVLGVGSNGHIGFNEPTTPFCSRTQVVELVKSTIEANARYFDSIEEVPRRAISMGIQTIMEAREIILFANGESKAEAMYQLLANTKVTENWPVTILKKHPKVTVIIDEAASHKILNLLYNYNKEYEEGQYLYSR